jgi:hypothetical protein
LGGASARGSALTPLHATSESASIKHNAFDKIRNEK